MRQLLVEYDWSTQQEERLQQILDMFYQREITIPLKWCLPDEEEEEVALRVMAEHAHQAIENLDADFKKANKGKFIVMSYSGKVLALGNTMEEIAVVLKERNIHENAHIERLGYKYVAKTVR